MRSREPRRKVLIQARMRTGASWGDINILNISSRGMMIQARQVPPRGAYLEVRRGQQAIVARVVWSGGQRFGVRTQDQLCLESLLREPDRSTPEARSSGEAAAPLERRQDRHRQKVERDLERSRTFSRAVEFACLGIMGMSAAYAGFELVRESFGAPLAQVSAALAGR